MSSAILRPAVRWLAPLLLLFSVFLWWVGHNEPGGGFVGGLVAASAFALLVFSQGSASARHALRIPPSTLSTGGLAIALASGLVGPATGRPFLAASWFHLPLPGGEVLKLGTPLLFDLGVYFLVLGVTLSIVFALAEEEGV